MFCAVWICSAPVSNSLAAAVLPGIRHQRAGGGNNTGSLYGRPGHRCGGGRSRGRTRAPSHSGVRGTGSRDCTHSAGGAGAVSRSQCSLWMDARRSTESASCGNYWPAGVLPDCGVFGAGIAHRIHGSNITDAHPSRGATQRGSRLQSGLTVRNQHRGGSGRHRSGRFHFTAGSGTERHSVDRSTGKRSGVLHCSMARKACTDSKNTGPRQACTGTNRVY